MIGGQLEGDATTGRQHLPAAHDIDDRCDLAVEVPAHGDQPVLHRVLGDHHTFVGSRLGERAETGARRLDHRWCSVDDDDLATIARGCIGHCADGRRNDGHGLGDDLLEAISNA